MELRTSDHHNLGPVCGEESGGQQQNGEKQQSGQEEETSSVFAA